jgi:hypothetical protein
MSFRSKLVACIALTIFAPASYAQYYYNPDTATVRWHIMGGLNQPVGDTEKILQTGWNFGGGVTFHQPDSPVAFRIDLDYAYNNATKYLQSQGSAASGLQITGGWADLWTLTGNIELRFPFSPAVYGYAIAGGGAYYTRVSLTEYGYGYVCNPWWYYCYVGTGAFVVDAHETTKFGWNAGLGVGMRLRGGSQLFVEARFNQIQFQQNFEYVPILVGWRF